MSVGGARSSVGNFLTDFHLIRHFGLEERLHRGPMRLCSRAGTVAADAALKSLYSKRQPGGASLRGGAFLEVSVPTRPPTTSLLNRARLMETACDSCGAYVAMQGPA